MVWGSGQILVTAPRCCRYDEGEVHTKEQMARINVVDIEHHNTLHNHARDHAAVMQLHNNILINVSVNFLREEYPYRRVGVSLNLNDESVQIVKLISLITTL